MVGNARGLHKELNSNLVCVVKLLLRLSCNCRDVVDAQLELVFLEKVEQIFINETLGKQLQHFQVRVVRVTETCVLETRVVNCPHLVEQVKCDLSCSN